MKLKSVYCLSFLIFFTSLFSQEGIRPLTSNLNLIYSIADEPSTKVDLTNNFRAKSISDSLPFIDDFNYSPVNNYPLPTKWSDSSVYINSGYPIAPPSIGVATFDGLNQNGFPYNPNLVNMNQSLPADVLTSVPINLSKSGGMPLEPSSKVALSFYYQAKGHGDMPELTDSLILDFYKPRQGKWKQAVWFSKGFSNPNTNDTVFKRVFVWVKDTAYLADGFKFRFRNYATTAGNFDHWHLDYVHLDKNRDSIADTVYADLAFAYVPRSFLNNYSAMPFRQFVASEMALKTKVLLRNNGKDAKNITYAYKIFDPLGNEVHSYNGGFNNIKPYKPFGYSTAPAHANPAVSYTFPAMVYNSDFRINHLIFQTDTVSDFIKENDRLTQFQTFRNYYAFDDGSSEGGYYVNAIGAKIAIKIKVNVADTLSAVQIYFDPAGSITATQNYNFKISLWADGNNKPGTLLYENASSTPAYLKTGFKMIPEYKLNEKKLLSPGVYYVGIQQQVSSGTIIAIGFDKNNDFHKALFFDAGNGWEMSDIKGAIMIRPVFGEIVAPPVGINKQEYQETEVFKVYPNPSSGWLTLSTKEEIIHTAKIFNAVGQIVFEGEHEGFENQINTESLSTGVYFLIIESAGRILQKQKLIIQR